jgi:hypothetical protein
VTTFAFALLYVRLRPVKPAWEKWERKAKSEKKAAPSAPVGRNPSIIDLRDILYVVLANGHGGQA